METSAKILADRPDQSRRGAERAGLPWSSLAGDYALPPRRRAKWLAAEDDLNVFGYLDTAAGRQKMVERLDRRAVEEKANHCGVPVLPEEIDARCSHLRRGWYWGSQKFSEKLIEVVKGVIKKPRSRGYRAAPEQKAHGYAEAEALLQSGLKAADLNVKTLNQLKSADPRKLYLAAILRRRTIVTNAWLAEKLHLKSAANVSQRLRTMDLAKLKKKLPKTLLTSLGCPNLESPA